MTKTLTEQWRDGKLSENTYYVQFLCGRYGIYEFEQFKGFGFDNDLAYIKEVVAPVPSYEEWQSCDKCADMLIDVNKKWGKTIKERKRLEKQLAIATKALKEYARCENGSYANKALTLIKEVK